MVHIGFPIYAMTQKINFIKMIRTQQYNLIFEQELFDILLKNKYAIKNDSTSYVMMDDSVVFANTDYPFSLIICSKDALRSSILINNIYLVLVKFVLYLCMMNQNVARPDYSNCFLAVNIKLLPFGRICIDVDYKMPAFGSKYHETISSDEEYEKFVEKYFGIVCEMTTTGNIIMTANCFTPNTPSFHLITKQLFDATTRNVIFTQISKRIKDLDSNVQMDQVYVQMLPFGRGHTPVRKYHRKTNEFRKLDLPYTEADFKLTMPFDLSLGTDNIHTLYNVGGRGEVMKDDDQEQYDVLNEYLNDDVIHSYYIAFNANIVSNTIICYECLATNTTTCS